MKQWETKDFKFTMSASDDEAGTFTGYASIFGAVDSYGDVVERGAFKRTIKNSEQFPLLWSHSVESPIGIIKAKEDQTGLKVEGQLNLDVQRAKEIRSLMKQGAVQGLSIGYQVIKDEIGEVDKAPVRFLKEVKLWEISPVVFQACPAALVSGVKADDTETDESVQLCEHCADALEVEEPEQSTPPVEPQPLDKGSPDHLHLLAEFKDQLLALKNLMEVK